MQISHRIPALASTLLAISFFLGIAAVACGGESGGPGTSQPETPSATSITLTPDSLFLDSIGATAQLTASVRDQNNQLMAGATVSWSSSVPTVASVSTQGLVTALADGSTTIRVTSGNASASSRAVVARILFATHPLETGAHGNAGLFPEDIDGDGDMDFVATSSNDDEVAWWRNDGGQPLAWAKLPVGVGFESPLYVHAADVDGDGLVDVIATGQGPENGLVAWWKNDGGDPSGWSMQTLATVFMGASGIVSGDFDGDGRTDLLAAAFNDSEIAWWRNGGGDPIVWTMHTVTNDFNGVQSVVAVDLDGDGRTDILGGSGPDGGNRDQVAWWRNEGGDPVAWTKYIIATGFAFAHCVHAEDVDGDGRMDVMGMSYTNNEIAWWRNEGGEPLAWIKETIDGAFLHPLTVTTADMDGDGDIDVVGTGWTPGHVVAWWEASGSHPTIQWHKHRIATSFTGAWPLLVADLDGDGDQDVVAGADVLTGGGESAPLTWWENLRGGGG